MQLRFVTTHLRLGSAMLLLVVLALAVGLPGPAAGAATSAPSGARQAADARPRGMRPPHRERSLPCSTKWMRLIGWMNYRRSIHQFARSCEERR
jgi:hypothetical protein